MFIAKEIIIYNIVYLMNSFDFGISCGWGYFGGPRFLVTLHVFTGEDPAVLSRNRAPPAPSGSSVPWMFIARIFSLFLHGHAKGAPC